MSNLISEEGRVIKRVFQEHLANNLVTPPGLASTLFSLARATSNEFVSCTLRETQGCRFQVSCHYFANQDFRPMRDVSLFPLSREIHNCQWIKLKENKFSYGRILRGLFSRRERESFFPPLHSYWENKSYTPMLFPRLPRLARLPLSRKFCESSPLTMFTVTSELRVCVVFDVASSFSSLKSNSPTILKNRTNERRRSTTAEAKIS